MKFSVLFLVMFFLCFQADAYHAESESFPETISASWSPDLLSDHRMMQMRLQMRFQNFYLFSWNLCDRIALKAFPEKKLAYGTGAFKETPITHQFFTYLQDIDQEDFATFIETEDELQKRLIRQLKIIEDKVKAQEKDKVFVYLQEVTYLTPEFFEAHFSKDYAILHDAKQGLAFIYKKNNLMRVETGEHLLKGVEFPESYIRQVVMTHDTFTDKKILHINTHHKFFKTADEYAESVNALKALYDLEAYDEIITGGDWNIAVAELKSAVTSKFGSGVAFGYDLDKGSGNGPFFEPDARSRAGLENLGKSDQITGFSHQVIDQFLAQKYTVHDYPIDGFFVFSTKERTDGCTVQ